MRGNFYFAQFCGTPPPEESSLDAPYKLWGSVTSEDVATPPIRKDYELLSAKNKMCNMLISSAYSLKELLRESFGKKMPAMDPDHIDKVYKMWDTPHLLADTHALSFSKKIIRTLRKPLKDKKLIRFRGIFTWEGYKKAFFKFEKLTETHPALFCVICLLCRTLTTTRLLKLENLLGHEYVKETMSNFSTCASDRSIAESLKDFM